MPLVRIHFGFRTPAFGTPAFDALEVAGQILAGGKGSRLHKRLVRELRLAQDVTLFSLPMVSGASICAGWVTVRPEVDAADVEAAYMAELERIASEPVSDDELARAHALIESSELAALGRVEEVADRLSQYASSSTGRSWSTSSCRATWPSMPRPSGRSAPRSSGRDNLAVITFVPRADEVVAA